LNYILNNKQKNLSITLQNKEILIKVPHRISGFFQIVDEINGIKISNPEKVGSRGAGFCLNAYSYTRISIQDIENSNMDNVNILINGQEQTANAQTSYYIYSYLKKYFRKPVKMIIDHNFDLPVGSGYGASGSGAIGSALGINALMKLNLKYDEVGKIAHIAEVENKTGLGTVAGLWYGGLSILLEAGYPFCVKKITYPKNLKVISGSFGEIQTKSILSDSLLSFKIKKAGKLAMKNLLKSPNVFAFMQESIKFVKKIDLLNLLNLSECRNLINSLNKLKKVKSSMNQLGNAVFSICFSERVSDIVEIYESYKPEVKIFELEICPNGPKIIKP